MRREGVTYTLHHIGIPTDITRPGERYAPSVDMYTSDDLTGPLPIQWHRFGPDCKLAEPMRSQPHIAYKVDNLLAAIEGHRVILGPYEPLDDFRVAVIDNGGMPIEFIQTTLTDAEIWHRAGNASKAQLYR
jgi:hypothetical protein